MDACPLLSVVITAHNSERWLQATLDSIINALTPADLEQCEFIITDDASADGTPAIIAAFTARYRHAFAWQTQFKNIGKVRNFAVARCRGQYILMIDGDDRLIAAGLSQKLAHLRTHAPDIYINRLIEIPEDAPEPVVTLQPVVTLDRDEAITRFLLHRDYQGHVIGQFFRRDMLRRVAFPDYVCYEDAWVFPQVLMHSEKIIFSSQGFYLYLKRTGSLSVSLSADKIHCLYATLENLDACLPDKFKNLIHCHWIDFAHRHYGELAEPLKDLTRRRLGEIDAWRFYRDSNVRLSQKRKFYQVKKKAR
ncbi:glycosyltransferase family 2 protein [Pantoea sp. 1.19]|uniref:glycosyltransferase family 2 protein n=1 Tax=Pantoea sp. 1.19 TaxID=1925589 RepID=UPI0009489004|nr:glycosyltransferase family 2 protein [Pantoea sp. 1.19]